MKGFFRIFELSKNEQRVVLIVMFLLLMLAFIEYERHVDHSAVQRTSPAELRPSPSPLETENHSPTNPGIRP